MLVQGKDRSSNYKKRTFSVSSEVIEKVCRKMLKDKIKKIYNDSHQNYGAHKVMRELRKAGETISERTVGKYMKQMGIKAKWIRPWTITTWNSDFSSELQKTLNEQVNPKRPNAVWCSDITYIRTTEGFVYHGLILQKDHCMDAF